ncbi:hypothetical protein [Ruminococcus flavefaciens]|uniref:hypothetical protein n=1 Tax=Ruminococcus flavefaciens TaxID=1265 RepID=UPI0026E97C76|nr:hypothetical protein [Ruminococcus flavefaciens]
MILDQIRAVYEEYSSQVAKLEGERKVWDGLFGMGKKLSDDPCHERFIEELEKLLKGLAEEKPSSEVIRVVLEFIYSTPCDEEQPSGTVMPMNAVHSLTVGLAEQLSPADAAELLEQYTRYYPKSKRFPVHKTVIKTLERVKTADNRKYQR